MDIQAIAFDINGTLINILTDESREDIYRAIKHFLALQGIFAKKSELRDAYFGILKDQQRSSHERYPEYDAVEIWRRIIQERMTDVTRSRPEETLRTMPLFLAQMHRSISRERLQLYPNVRNALDRLRERFTLVVVTDAQSAFARGELGKVGLNGYFQNVIVSGDYGFRKPDTRLFQMALEGTGIAADRTLFIGNDMQRDIYGARKAGMKTMMYNSDQGRKSYKDVSADYSFSDYRDLPRILGLPG